MFGKCDRSKFYILKGRSFLDCNGQDARSTYLCTIYLSLLYQGNLLCLIQEYIDEEWILSYNFSVDILSNYLAFIQGKLEFRRENKLIFCYDNAKHKPDWGYSNHKHINNQIIPSVVPEIEEIILVFLAKIKRSICAKS